MSDKTKENLYDTLMSVLTKDEKVAITLKNNICFVGKYLSKVETNFDNDDEREIAYRELGAIAFSCIELLLKKVLMNINKECDERKCKNKCAFRCNIKKIEKKSLMEVVDLLYNSQLLWLKEDEYDELLWLREQRNGTHLSKDLDLNVESETYDKQYVQRMINCFLKMLTSLNDNLPYFYWVLYCSEQFDGKKAENMESFKKKRQTLLCRMRLFYILQKLFANEELTDKEKWSIERIEFTDYIDFDVVIESINDTIDNYIKRCNLKENAEAKRIELLKKFTSYIKKDDIKKRILEYNGVKKQTENTQ